MYLALTFWLVMVVIVAWGVHRLWLGMVPGKLFHALLLPGTLIAQLGHVLGLLITGATVNNTTLIKDDESGEPETTPDPKPRVPVIGPIIIGMLPLLACGTGIYFVARELGRTHMERLSRSAVTSALPTSLAGVWQLMRNQVTLVESWVNVTRSANFSNWQTWLFFYLLICFAIRMAPFVGNLRGSLAAIVILGLAAALISSLFDVADPRVQHGWSVLNLTVATLYFLLLVSALLRGLVGLIRILHANEA